VTLWIHIVCSASKQLIFFNSRQKWVVELWLCSVASLGLKDNLCGLIHLIGFSHFVYISQYWWHLYNKSTSGWHKNPRLYFFIVGVCWSINAILWTTSPVTISQHSLPTLLSFHWNTTAYFIVLCCENLKWNRHMACKNGRIVNNLEDYAARNWYRDVIVWENTDLCCNIINLVWLSTHCVLP